MGLGSGYFPSICTGLIFCIHLVREAPSGIHCGNGMQCCRLLLWIIFSTHCLSIIECTKNLKLHLKLECCIRCPPSLVPIELFFICTHATVSICYRCSSWMSNQLPSSVAWMGVRKFWLLPSIIILLLFKKILVINGCIYIIFYPAPEKLCFWEHPSRGVYLVLPCKEGPYCSSPRGWLLIFSNARFFPWRSRPTCRSSSSTQPKLSDSSSSSDPARFRTSCRYCKRVVHWHYCSRQVWWVVWRDWQEFIWWFRGQWGGTSRWGFLSPGTWFCLICWRGGRSSLTFCQRFSSIWGAICCQYTWFCRLWARLYRL